MFLRKVYFKQLPKFFKLFLNLFFLVQKQHQYSQKIMKPSTSTSFATLTPVPIKRKAELPLEEIGNTGGLKHRRGRPRKPEDGGH